MKSVLEVLKEAFNVKTSPEYEAAAQWLEGQIKHVPEERRLEWVKPLRDIDTLANEYGMQLTTYYLRNDLRKEFSYGEFVDGASIMCIVFYQLNGGEMSEETRHFLEKNSFGLGNGGEGTHNVISEGKDGSGRFIVSSIL